MLRSERRVVITGLGLVSPIGIGPDAFWTGLAESRGAVDHIKAFTVEGLTSDAGGEIANFDPRQFAIPKIKKALVKSLKYMARDIQLAVAAAQMAVADAGLADGGVDPTRIGVDLGAGIISSELDELTPAVHTAFLNGKFDYQAYGREGIPLIQPIWLLKYLPNMLACHISILLDCQGPSNTITQSESASNVAIGEAARIIGRGRADVMIAGGADSKIHPLSLVRMGLLGQMTRWQGEPRHACRPFDRARDGWVPGEGAGILILEERSHALARGARIYGEVLGYASACDAAPSGGLDPLGSGTEMALRGALRDAELVPAEIGHVNAHGLATVVSDLAEARALARVFGPHRVPVTGLKGFMGNLASGCGAVELIGSLLGARQGSIPPTLNCDDPDPECEIDVVRSGPRSMSNPIFAKTNLTNRGQASALIVKAETAVAASPRSA
jgi:3-oxoacyl-[acyl-carrier-protein] synthase II